MRLFSITTILKKIISLLIMGILLTGPVIAADPPSLVDSPLQDISFYTEQLPPYNYAENGTLKGLSVDLLQAVSTQMGYTLPEDQIHVAPWNEAYNATVNGTNACLFVTVRIPARENLFKWAGPISIEHDVLFASPEKNITISSPEDLKGLRIGVTPDHAGTQILLDMGVTKDQLVTEKNVSVLIEKLQSDEIDLWCYPELTGRYYAEQVTGDYYAFDLVYPLDDIGIYYAFSRDMPDSTVQSFQNALDVLKTENDDRNISTYDRILGSYIPSVGLSHLQYLTEEWAPYNYLKNGKPAGISVDILVDVFKELLLNLSAEDIRIVSLSEGFEQAQGNTSTVLFSIARSPERESLYQWVGPFTKGNFVIFGPVIRNISISSPEDLNWYRIGTVTGTIENTLLTDIGVENGQIVNGNVPEDLIQMLVDGSIDLWATGDMTGRYEMEKSGVNPDSYEIVYTLSENDFYFIFSKDVPSSLVQAFDKALNRVLIRKEEIE